MKESTTKSFAELSTFHIGGKIQKVLHPETPEECVEAVQKLIKEKKVFFILGGGSNILPADEPYEGVVITPAFDHTEYQEIEQGMVSVIADAGVVWDKLVQETIHRNLWGLENLSGIPGLVGASPIQNIGAYGTDVSKTIEWVEVYDLLKKETRRLDNKELLFGYRTSLLKEERGRFIVLRVSFALSLVSNPNISYKDVQNYFASKEEEPSLSNIREAILTIRATKFPDLNKYGTAGSFFTNPIVSSEEAKRILSIFPNAVHFEEEEGVKFSLAWILDNVLHIKGMKEGNAVVWHAQPLVLVAEQGATSKEVRALAEKIILLVKEKIGITIVPEVLFL